MITVSDLSLSFSGQALFSHVDLLFTEGNCYGVIGANGAGKSTFLRILSGELEPTGGTVSIDPKLRMSVLKQDHHAYDDYTVFETILMGNPRLFMPRRTSRMKTATVPPSWRRSLRSLTAGRLRRRPAACCRASASTIWRSIPSCHPSQARRR